MFRACAAGGEAAWIRRCTHRTRKDRVAVLGSAFQTTCRPFSLSTFRYRVVPGQLVQKAERLFHEFLSTLR